MKLVPLWLLILTITRTAAAQVVCGTFADPPTFSSQVEGADALALVRWVGGTPGTDIIAGTSQFKVVDLNRDLTNSIDVSLPIELPYDFRPSREELILLVGEKRREWVWTPIRISEAAYRYVCDAPDARLPARERLPYFFGFLDHADPEIQDDAWLEFYQTDFEHVAAFAKQMDPAILRSLITNTKINRSNRGQAAIYLGYCGTPRDALFLRDIVLTPTDGIRLEIPGVMAGYLLLSGKKGLELLEREKLADPKEAFSETYAAMQAVRFVWEHGEERIPQERVATAMHLLLDRPEIADVAIADLARWQDWSVIDRVYELYDAEEYADPAIKRSIIRYLYFARQAGGAGEDFAAEERTDKATHYLDDIIGRDTQMVEYALRYVAVPAAAEEESE